MGSQPAGLYRRRSRRLVGYDYSLAGAYFITICTANRAALLCAIDQQGADLLMPAGQLVRETWLGLPEKFPQVGRDAFVVMPNHVHGVLVFSDPRGRPKVAKPLGAVIRSFKATSSRRIRHGGLTEFAWQQDYYDHIIRNEKELDRVREYIAANPARWGEDPENLAASPSGVQTEPWAE